jgi:hypothetical protein
VAEMSGAAVQETDFFGSVVGRARWVSKCRPNCNAAQCFCSRPVLAVGVYWWRNVGVGFCTSLWRVVLQRFNTSFIRVVIFFAHCKVLVRWFVKLSA